MLINLSNQLFKTKLDCSSVSLDGYSPSNLLSSNWRERNQGFMAAHFIKPPVFLLFQFAFPIQIHSVDIKPKVGSQISAGFDLLVAGVKPRPSSPSEPKTSCEDNQLQLQQDRQHQLQQIVVPLRSRRKRKYDDFDDKSKTKDISYEEKLHEPKREKMQEVPEPNYDTSVTIESFKNSHRSIFTLVSRINEQCGKTLRIVNNRCSEAQSSSTFEGAIEYDFFHANALGYVTHLMLIITRVKGSCVPCLNMIEIWGKPYVNCNKSIIDCAYEIQKQINGQREGLHVNSATKMNIKESCTNQKDNDVIINDDDDIPNEFRDPITCNLMTIPMLLPSGLNIDMTTLEKHNIAERQWGRMPSDPFTGVVFTNTVKPIPNSVLKVRIDKYILSSGIDVNDYGRTVGRTLSSNKQDGKVTMINKGKVVRLYRRDSKFSHSNVGSSIKINKDVVNTGPKSATKGNERNSQCTTVSTKITDEGPHLNVIQSYEEQISNSLDDALMKTLQGATFTRKQATQDTVNISCSSLIQDGSTYVCSPHTSTYSPSTQPVVKAQGPKTCICCKVTLDIAFRLPCQHSLCRKCVLLKCSSTKKPVCSLCKHPFLRKEVVKVHSV